MVGLICFLKSTQAVLKAADAATRSNTALTLTIAVAYGGRDEIADAVREMLNDKASQGQTLETVIDQVTPEAIAKHLYAVDLPEPDLIRAYPVMTDIHYM